MEIKEIALVVAAAFFFMLMLVDHYFFEKRIKEVEDRFIRYRTDIHNKMSNILDSNENVLEHSNRCIALCNDMMFSTEKMVNETKELIATFKDKRDEDRMDDVVKYCENDVRVTEEVFLAHQGDFAVAPHKIQAKKVGEIDEHKEE